MTNYLGEWFWGQRAERQWSLGDVARRLGYANVSKGANKVQRFERDGLVDDDFLVKLAALYGVSEGVVRYLSRQDRNEYLRASLSPGRSTATSTPGPTATRRRT